MLAHFFAEREALFAGGAGFGGFEFERVVDGQGHVGEKLGGQVVLQARDFAEFGAVDGDGDDRGSCFGGGEGGAGVDFHQAVGDGQAPFGKDDDGPAGFEQAHDAFDGVGAGGVDFEGVDHFCELSQDRAVLDGGVDQEDGAHGQMKAQKDAVEEGRMVGDDQKPLVVEMVGVAGDLGVEHDFGKLAGDAEGEFFHGSFGSRFGRQCAIIPCFGAAAKESRQAKARFAGDPPKGAGLRKCGESRKIAPALSGRQMRKARPVYRRIIRSICAAAS